MSFLLCSLLVPLQIGFRSLETSDFNPYWLANATVDAVRIFGLPSHRNKVPLANHNPELNLREETKEDKPLTRRKQFIQDYVNNTVALATR